MRFATILFFASLLISLGCLSFVNAEPATTQPASRFQVRLVVPASDPNAESLPSFDASQPVTRVSKQIELSDADLESAHALYNADENGIEIRFTDAGADKFAAFTRTHLHQQIAFVVDGKILCAPIINSEVRSIGCLSLGNHATRTDAENLAHTINQVIDGRTPATQPGSH